MISERKVSEIELVKWVRAEVVPSLFGLARGFGISLSSGSGNISGMGLEV